MKYLPIRIWSSWALKATGAAFLMQEKGGYLHLTDAETRSLGIRWLVQAQRTGDGFLIQTPFHAYHTLLFSGFFMRYGNKLLTILENKFNFFLVKLKYEGIRLICLIGLFLASVFRALLSCQEQLYLSKTNLKNN